MKLLSLFIVAILFAPYGALAQTTPVAPPFEETVFRAEVLSIESTGTQPVVGTSVQTSFQVISVRIIEGIRTGEVVRVENDTPIMFSPGEKFYLHKTETEQGDMWVVGEPDRRGILFVLAGLFVFVAVVAVGWAGFRSLLALIGSFLLIVFGLLPALALPFPPALIATVFAILILAFGMYVTHGWNSRTHIALFGSVVALGFAALLAYGAVAIAQLSGFASDETVALNFAHNGTLDLPSLLLGSILIGIVGILNDVSVSQVHTVAELHEANPELSKKQILEKATKVGQEHLGAVITTLPLAYAGASLPLLLLFSYSQAPFLFIINREIFAAELIRTFAGGIGLMGSGVIATLVAVFLLVKRNHDKMIEKQ